MTEQNHDETDVPTSLSLRAADGPGFDAPEGDGPGFTHFDDLPEGDFVSFAEDDAEVEE